MTVIAVRVTPKWAPSQPGIVTNIDRVIEHRRLRTVARHHSTYARAHTDASPAAAAARDGDDAG